MLYLHLKVYFTETHFKQITVLDWRSTDNPFVVVVVVVTLVLVVP